MLATLPVLAMGLWRSGMLGQALWPRALALQALALLVAAGLATLGSIYLVPVRLRGWPALGACGLAFTAAACGGSASAAVGLVALCCLVIGYFVHRATDPEGGAPGVVLCAATGLGALLLALVGIATVRLPLLPVALFVPGTVIVALCVSARARADVLGSLVQGGAAEPWTTLRAGVAWLILTTWFFYAANAGLPERFYDPLAMHLLIPTQALTFGHWTPDPLRFALGFFPIAADDLFAFAMALGGENAPTLINLAALAGVLLLLHGIVREFAGALLAEVTVLLVLSLPIALLCSATAMVENVLAFQMAAALAAVLRLRTQRVAALTALAVLLPAMAATKLHGVVAGLPCMLLALPALRGLPWRTLWRLVAVVVPAAVLGVAQYASAWVRTGNPVYPLMNGWFRSPFWPPVDFEDVRWQGHLSWRLLYRMTFDSRTYVEGDNGAMGVALLLLLGPGVVATVLVPRRAPLVALGVGGFYALVIVVKFQYIRYLWPAFPLLLICAAYGIAVLGPRMRLLGLSMAGVAAGLGLFLLPSAGWVLKVADLRAVWDPAARHAMLATQAPTRLAVDAINALGPGKPRVLFGGAPYGAFLRGVPIYAVWSNRPLNAALLAAGTAEAVAAVLAGERLDYIVCPVSSADPMEQKVIAYAQTHGARVPLEAGAALWRMR